MQGLGECGGSWCDARVWCGGEACGIGHWVSKEQLDWTGFWGIWSLGLVRGQGSGLGAVECWDLVVCSCAWVQGQVDLGCGNQLLGGHYLGGGYDQSPTWAHTLLQAVAVTHEELWLPTALLAPAPVTVAQVPAPAGPTWWARAVTAVYLTSGALGGQGAVSPVAATLPMP